MRIVNTADETLSASCLKPCRRVLTGSMSPPHNRLDTIVSFARNRSPVGPYSTRSVVVLLLERVPGSTRFPLPQPGAPEAYHWNESDRSGSQHKPGVLACSSYSLASQFWLSRLLTHNACSPSVGDSFPQSAKLRYCQRYYLSTVLRPRY